MTDGLERRGELWTDEENADLIAAGDKREEWGDIGVRLHRTRWSCKVQYNFLKRQAEGLPPKLSFQRMTREKATALAKVMRDTRPQHRSITAELFGDPLPGRSALDQRRSEASGITLATELVR